MKVLLVTDWYLKLVVEGQATALAQLGHEVVLLCRGHADEFGGLTQERSVVLDRLRESGVRIFEIPGRRYGPESFPAVVTARRELREWGPDIVSAHQNSDPRLLYIARGAPIVYTVHDPEPHPGERTLHLRERLAASLWLRAAACIVIHGEELRGQLSNRERRREVRVIPHGIDVAAEPLPAPVEPNVLLFGRLEHYKGVGVLLEAMQRVWETHPDARLTIAGRGPAAGEVPTDIKIALVNRYIGEAELRALISDATVVALPYIQASQSGVGLLSISQGVPIVVTNVGALPELVPKPEFVVPPNDPQALSIALLDVLRADQEIRDQFLRHASRFSWTDVAARYVAVYSEFVR